LKKGDLSKHWLTLSLAWNHGKAVNLADASVADCLKHKEERIAFWLIQYGVNVKQTGMILLKRKAEGKADV
jgi:hypothetical protein